MTRKSKRQQKLPKYLTESQVHNIFDAIPYYELRDSALIALMVGAGLRVAEAVNLEACDINFVDRLIYVRDGKGGRDRTIPFKGKTFDRLNTYLRGRSEGKAILSKVGRHPITPRQVRRIVREHAMTADPLLEWVHPHTFRHSYAVMLLQRGITLRTIQRLLGHSSLDHTMIYLDLTGQDIQDEIESAELAW